MPYQLIAAPLSLYSGKVRGYMRWKNIAYREVLSSRSVYQDTIMPRIGYPIIPIMITPDDQTVQDTTDMIEYIEAHETTASITPTTPKQHLAALIFELFGDEYLRTAAMHYRWNYNKEFAWAEFGATAAPHLGKPEQLEVGKTAATKFMGMLPALGITDKSIPAIEASYEQFLSLFNTHLETHSQLLGTRPSIGDYGLLGPLYAHNYRDPASGEIMKRLAPNVAKWCLGTHAPQHPLSGDFLEDDLIPHTLIPLLKMFTQEQLPILLNTAKHLQIWAQDKETGTEVPRALGMHTININGTEENAAIIPYSLWMYQRVTDYVATLEHEDLASVKSLLKTIGAEIIAIPNTTPRLTRKNFKLVLA
ncbi:MAG: glutathione S-transferase [Robiginitomaculum sp.]|nr:MAG: glutathione S-transferase [Robiginitomaculum sp.]